MQVSRLFIYPIKSLIPVEVQFVTVTDTGLEHDRSFILIKDTEPNEDGLSEFLTIKTTSQLCLFRQSIDAARLILTVVYTMDFAPIESIKIILQPSEEDLETSKNFMVDIFGTRSTGFDMGDAAAAFFSKHLDQPTRLLFIGGKGRRDIPIGDELIPRKPSQFPWLFKDELHTQRVKFHDAAPILLTTDASEEDARSRLPAYCRDEDVITRFRPNIHIAMPKNSDFRPYEEDNWKKASISSAQSRAELELDISFRTPRCTSLNVDFKTRGTVAPERQLFKFLTKYRRVSSLFATKPCFGVYAWAVPSGFVVRVGDKVRVVERQS